jgi:hypothetical protein
MKGKFLFLFIATTLIVVFINANIAKATEPETTLWIPAVAVGEFPSGHFTTEVSIRTSEGGMYGVETSFEFAPFGVSLQESNTSYSNRSNFPHMTYFEDFMRNQLFLNNTAGVIRISSQQGFRTTAIIRNEMYDGNAVNQTVPVVGESQLFDANERAEIFPTQLSMSGDMYTNIFFLNASPEPATFTVTVYNYNYSKVLTRSILQVDGESGNSIMKIAHIVGRLREGITVVNSTSNAWYAFGSRVEPSGDNITIWPWTEYHGAP